MFRAFSTFCFIILFSSSLFAQKTINSYKYIIVPKQFEFQKSEDQYQINSLTKFLFEKENFTVFYSDDAYPPELAGNTCLALKAIVKDASSMLTTKANIVLLDCYNKVVYTSPVGKSKIKDYKKGYNDAIRKSFEGIKELGYTYDGTTAIASTVPKTVTAPIKEISTAEPIKEQLAEIPVVKPVEEKAIETKKDIDTAVKAVNSTAVVAVAAVPVIVPKQEAKVSEPQSTVKSFSIEGTYFIDMWGECVISKKGNDFKVVGGDENFEFAEIYTTSKSTIFMVKKTGFKQTQLLELDENGNLKIDSKSGVKIYKRIN